MKFRAPVCVHVLYVGAKFYRLLLKQCPRIQPSRKKQSLKRAQRWLGQLFTGDGPQSSAMTSESLSMHNTFQEYPHTEDSEY